MNVHENARLTPLGRERMVRQVLSGEDRIVVAEQHGVSVRTVAKWLARFRAEGVAGLRDRSSRPHRSPWRTDDGIAARIITLRCLRWTGKHVAREVGVLAATVSRVLRRAGLSRMRDLDPPEPERRYQHAEPGDMIHLDIKKLGRFDRPGHRVTGSRHGQSNPRSKPGTGTGWEYVHVSIDDRSRIAFTQLHPDEKATSAVAHLRAAIAYYRSLGITVHRVMTDNGSCYIAHAFQAACRELGLKHVRTKPYTPRTNGKAERFIQTSLREWAYARAYQSSQQRADELPRWTHLYNWHRPHGGIGDQTPISQLSLPENNLMTLHI